MLNDRGGVIDDLIVYRIADQAFLMVVNAAKIGEDWTWIERHLTQGGEVGSVVFFNKSDAFAAVALQGPKAAGIAAAALEIAALPARNRIAAVKWRTHDVWIARTGYTGEDGFELFCAPEAADELWEVLLREGGSGLKPCGLGCRDTLRLEACYPLNGQDLSPERRRWRRGSASSSPSVRRLTFRVRRCFWSKRRAARRPGSSRSSRSRRGRRPAPIIPSSPGSKASAR